MSVQEDTYVVPTLDDRARERPTAGRAELALCGVIAILVMAHCLQVFSPMRLDLDAIGYLSKTVSLVERDEFGPTWHPAGYPYMLAGLEIMGLGNAWAFAGLNFLFFIAGIVASYVVLRQGLELGRLAALIVCGLTMLSFVYTKYLPIPLADPVYFGLGMTAVALLILARPGQREAWRLLTAATLVAVVAIPVRTAGITLISPLALGVWMQIRATTRAPAAGASGYGRPLFIAVGVIAGFAVVVLAMFTNHYFTQVLDAYARYGIGHGLSRMIGFRVHNLGELFVNAPESVAPDSLHVLYRPAGAIFLALILYGVVLRRRRFGAAEAYLVAVLLLLLVYPGRKVRYWLPVIPLLFGWAVVAVQSIPWQRVRRTLVAIYLVCFTLVGLVALGYSTRITFSGENVGEFFGSGAYHEVYQAAYSGTGFAEITFESGMQRRVFLLLRRYDPRLRGVEDASRTPVPEN